MEQDPSLENRKRILQAMQRIVRSLGRLRELRLLLVVLGFALAMWLYERQCLAPEDRGFFSPITIESTLLFMATYLIMACGMTVLLVSGGFDLSVGSVSALAAMVAAVLMKRPDIQMVWPAAFLIGLATGAAIGLLNGVCVAKLDINPFITTLATMYLARGLTYVVCGVATPDAAKGIAAAPSRFPAGFHELGKGQLLGIQFPIIVSLVLALVMGALLWKNRFFRQNYYIGGNEKAAWLSGIAVNKVKIFNYCLSGVLAALAGLLFCARYNSAMPNAGEGHELKVITAVIVGGASLSGGKGTVLGAFLGCLLLAMIRPAITFTGIEDDNWEKVIVGGILLVAVLLDRIGRK